LLLEISTADVPDGLLPVYC